MIYLSNILPKPCSVFDGSFRARLSRASANLWIFVGKDARSICSVMSMHGGARMTPSEERPVLTPPSSNTYTKRFALGICCSSSYLRITLQLTGLLRARQIPGYRRLLDLCSLGEPVLRTLFGSIITISERDGDLFIAVLGILVTSAGVSCW